ncbi:MULTISPECIES: ABC transporter ATP-binding protein [unclassified Microbacterium]|uniref:ABC transporter ATP-binding protein n=1 Tax=unclassified Microbacterium TaxID=2609290 RepID=UPI00226FE6FD|nr:MULTISPECIES: ABC transporter ATP-binding protein [unclassified Microbacterium]MDQ1177810.1 sulfonate transport system ATP-binding protein [Microbacterium sp. SORGH_AS_0421]WAC68966.1 ABC transporter ATP-binding protein [Microbacterium sp. SL75]
MPLAVRPPAVGRSAAPRGTVSLRGVERTFGATRTVLRGIQLDLAPAEIVTVIGPSGCGKSTLLRLLGGLDSPTAGRITVDGTAVRATDARTAMAFQEPRLLPWRTLAQNVALGLPRSTDRRSGTARVAELLDLVGLEAAAAHRPREVSGGMAQRASLARALARDPEVLLLDEPFGALDALTRLRMQDLLLEIHASRPTTIVLVTHDVEEALYLADRVVLLRALGDDDAASSVSRVIEVPGARPRDRADHTLTALRVELLNGLGVHTVHHSRQETP